MWSGEIKEISTLLKNCRRSGVVKKSTHYLNLAKACIQVKTKEGVKITSLDHLRLSKETTV